MSTSGQQTNLLLQRALDFLNRNDIAQAEATLTHILTSFPAEPNALQLMGLVRREQRRDDEAEDLYRRSLALRSTQPHVHHNLGNLLAAHSRFEEAVAAQREAIAQKSNYADAHYALGRALHELRRLEESERAYRNALRIQPNDVFAKQAIANVLIDQGRGDEAETLLRRILSADQLHPRQKAGLEHSLALALKQQRRFEDALPLLDAAQAKVPDMPFVDYSRAATLQNMNRNEEAVTFYRKAIARMPANARAHTDLNHLLYRLGRDSELLRSYDEAMPLHPDVGALPLGKAEFLMRLKRYDEAVEYFERAARLLPQSPLPLDRLALSQARAGRFDEAIAAHEATLRLDPQNAALWSNYADTLLRARDAKKALAASERAIAIDPAEQYGLSLYGLALRLLGDAREEELNDYKQLVLEFEIEAPDGYGDIESFNRDLNRWLDSVHVDAREAIDQSLRGGTQTLDNIFGAGHDLPDRLRAQIDRAIEIYISRMKDDTAHPFMNRRRKGFDYAGSWSARLRDRGFHANHIHIKGWISSAYYVSVPDVVEDEKEKQGWLQFGEPDFDAGLKDPVRRAIKPVAGKLVLFPSYMWHGTVPFHAPSARTTIAFDAVPR